MVWCSNLIFLYIVRYIIIIISWNPTSLLTTPTPESGVFDALGHPCYAALYKETTTGYASLETGLYLGIHVAYRNAKILSIGRTQHNESVLEAYKIKPVSEPQPILKNLRGKRCGFLMQRTIPVACSSDSRPTKCK